MTTVTDTGELVQELLSRLSQDAVAQALGADVPTISQWAKERTIQLSDEQRWRIVRLAYRHGFFGLLPHHGVQPISYDIGSRFDLDAPPVGFDMGPPLVPLLMRPTEIASGCRVDFPLGLPASVLAANSKWIEFYARRGFDIL